MFAVTSSIIIIATIIGVQSQSALLFKSNEIEFTNILYLIKQRHAKWVDSGGNGCSNGCSRGGSEGKGEGASDSNGCGDGCSMGGNKGKGEDTSDSDGCSDGCGNGCSKAWMTAAAMAAARGWVTAALVAATAAVWAEAKARALVTATAATSGNCCSMGGSEG